MYRASENGRVGNARVALLVHCFFAHGGMRTGQRKINQPCKSKLTPLVVAWDGQGIPSWYLGVSLKSSAAELTALQQAALAEPNGLPAGTANVYLDAKHRMTTNEWKLAA